MVCDLLSTSKLVLMVTLDHDAMKEKREQLEPRHPLSERDDAERNDDVIRIEDLAPRGNVTGGRKVLLGEVLTPLSSPRIPPES